MDVLRFKNDTRLRKHLMVPESFAHPAKMHGGMLLEIANRYQIKAGDWVLDPMGGSGTTMLLALQGINCCLIELEPHFIAPMKASWEKMKQHPMLGYALGEVLILRGDARCLPLGSVDGVITSPPYEAQLAEGRDGIDWTKMRRDGDVSQQPHLEQTTRYRGYTRPSAIITSPPYEGAETRDRYPIQDGSIADVMSRSYLQSKHARPVDAVVSSPPYEGSIQGARDGIDWSQQADGRKKQEPHGVGAHPWSYSRPSYEKTKSKVESGEYSGIRPDVWTSPTNMAAQGYLDGYSGARENIGNLRGQAYWESMRQVYAECHRVLRPGGIMALVLKGYTRDGQYVDLPQQTAELVQSLGFTLFDHWRRELWSLSFWRILQKRRDPAAFDDRLNYETVMAFRKG